MDRNLVSSTGFWGVFPLLKNSSFATANQFPQLSSMLRSRTLSILFILIDICAKVEEGASVS
jgi:hypothetical protein